MGEHFAQILCINTGRNAVISNSHQCVIVIQNCSLKLSAVLFISHLFCLDGGLPHASSMLTNHSTMIHLFHNFPALHFKLVSIIALQL